MEQIIICCILFYVEEGAFFAPNNWNGEKIMANAVMAIQVLPEADSTDELLRLVDVAIAEINATGMS